MSPYRKLDIESVLECAMHAFWETGYEATSVQRLVEMTGINRSNMYETFGDKRGLYFRVLDHYYKNVLSRITALSERPERGTETIRVYFEALSATLTSSIGRLGCLGQNSGVELAFRDPDAILRLREMYAVLVANFEAAFRCAISNGELPDSAQAADMARYLATIAQGMIVMARTSGDHRYIRSTERQVYAFLEGLRVTR